MPVVALKSGKITRRSSIAHFVCSTVCKSFFCGFATQKLSTKKSTYKLRLSLALACMSRNMEIVFEGPWFSSEEDEDQFFQAIYDLPQYSKIVGKGTSLYLELDLPLEEGTVGGLLQTFHRWGIDVSSLAALKPLLPQSELWNS